MAVVIETTLGDITVDLYLEQRPVTCLNFLKLCKMKYYNFNLFHTIRSGFIAQTGDPTGEGSGGESIFGLLEGPGKRFFSGEKMPKIRHTNAGLLSMVGTDDVMVGSQFFFTLGSDLDSLDSIHCVIGEVTEGHEVLRKLNEAICDETHRPYQDVRITHTVVLEDPFNDPPGFHAPSRSPSPSAERLKGGRIAPDEDIDETQGKSAEEIQEIIEEKEAKARATILEIVGDLPDADIAPPENVLFVCKLNPVTTDEDLEIIFSRFGEIVNCEVIRDKKTGDSLQYAFIEFSNKKSCEDAYFKMDNVLIDDRRIHVDFSQSVSKMRYLGKGRVQHFNDDEGKDNHGKQRFKRSGSEEQVRNRLNNKHTDREKHTRQRCDDERKIEPDERKRERDTEYKRRRDQDTSKERKKELDYENRKAERDFERRKEKHDHEERREKERDYEKRKRMDIESRQNSRRERSRSRSQEKSRSMREDSRENKHKNNEKNNYRNDNGSSKYDEEVNKRNKPGLDDSMQKERHSNSHKSKYKSPSRNRDSSSYRNEKVDKSSRRNHDNIDRNPKQNQIDDSKNTSRHESKKRHADNEESHSKNKRLKKKKPESVVPRTPSPVKSKNKMHKNKTKINEKIKKNSKRDKNAKKKRKVSTSTDSDSSESSSSSDSTSSSEDDRKKRSKKKRKHSTSSSSDSSDSSSSSSSSSDSSSDSSSSSSASEKNRKRKRNDTKKKVKQSKKKA